MMNPFQYSTDCRHNSAGKLGPSSCLTSFSIFLILQHMHSLYCQDRAGLAGLVDTSHRRTLGELSCPSLPLHGVSRSHRQFRTPAQVMFSVTLSVYLVRVWFIDGWYIITYGLGIYLLNSFIGFLSPQIDPDQDGPGLPVKDSEEFRPFSRRLPEFKFWLGAARAVATAFCMTFFEIFNVPVFWPILLLYFIALFVLTMKRQIMHMYKHRYVPWSSGKAKYKGKPPRS